MQLIFFWKSQISPEYHDDDSDYNEIMMMTMTIEKNVDEQKTKCEFKLEFSFASVMRFNTFASMVTMLG